MEKQKVVLKLSRLASLLGGTLEGPDWEVLGLSVPEDQKPGTICMINTRENASKTDGEAAAYAVAPKIEVNTDKPVIRIDSPREALVKMMIAFYPPEPIEGKISPKASVASTATLGDPVDIGDFVSIGENVSVGPRTKIYPGCVIGDGTIIGADCIIYPNAVIYENCRVGNNVIIHAGAVIGADGFGFIPGDNPVKIPQKGTVVLEDYAEIGANACIDRATIGETRIGFGTKLDDLVMVGHNTRLGKACLVASQAGFSGSIEAGDKLVVAGQVGFSDHIKIASGSVFGGQAGVPNDIKEPGAYLGTPCMPMLKFAKSMAVFQELPELKKMVRNIGKQND